MKTIEFSNLVSREERHYCAYLFAWFLMDKKNIKTYFDNHTTPIFDQIDDTDFFQCEVYYEYTAIRELIYFQKHVNKNPDTAKQIKENAEQFVFKSNTGDVQKKKADFAFYFPTKKKLVLTEAKFEMDYDKNQFGETKRYGEYLIKHFPHDIHEVVLTLVGTEYYNIKNPDFPSISWEKLTRLIDKELIRNEIIKGLNYQKIIHEKAMKNWNGN